MHCCLSNKWDIFARFHTFFHCFSVHQCKRIRVVMILKDNKNFSGIEVVVVDPLPYKMNKANTMIRVRSNLHLRASNSTNHCKL